MFEERGRNGNPFEMANEQRRYGAGFSEGPQLPGRLENRLFRLSQPQGFAGYALEMSVAECLNDIRDCMSSCEDLNRGRLISKAGSPAPCMRFGMKVAYENVSPDFGYAGQFA